MKIIFMGTGAFAVPSFEWLIDSPYDVIQLVTRPLAQRGKRRPPPNPMREVGERHGVSITDPSSVNDQLVIDHLAGLGADLFVVCDFGQILSKQVLEVPALGGINLHGSLLPAYRGAAPVNWAIYDGCDQTGVSVIHMTPRLDAGPVLSSRTTPIEPEETAEGLERRLAVIGVEAVGDAIKQLENWDQRSILGEVQNAKLASRAPGLSKADGLVIWSRRAVEIANQVRAFQPWPGTHTHFLRDKEATRLILHRAVATAESTLGVEPGTIADNPDQQLLVAATDCWVRLESVQLAGKKPISGPEFLRGYRLKPGDRFESVKGVS